MIRCFGAALGVALFCSATAFAQTGAIAGKVKGPDGGPLIGGLVKIERTDIKGNYKVKTNKKGEYFHAGLPLGTYNVTLEVNGQDVDKVQGVRTGLGDPKEVNFDLHQRAQQQQALQKAAETGELTKEQSREMSAEQKAAIEKAMKERSEAMKKNKALNDAFNNGMTAMGAKDYPVAIENLKKGTEMDAKQHVIWANLAEAYFGLAGSKTGDEQSKLVDEGSKAYNAAIELKPDDSAYHNNFGLALAKNRKYKEAEDELTKAAALDPTKAGTYFYNLGAIFTNIGQLEPAGHAFKKAIEADATHADAQYQYGVYLMSKAQTTADGKVIPPPGTLEAFQKYLELKPTGPFADSAKGMLQAIQSTLTTTFESPDAKKKSTKKR
jgi:tetratricopeptide (TPR) repeat protein